VRHKGGNASGRVWQYQDERRKDQGIVSQTGAFCPQYIRNVHSLTLDQNVGGSNPPRLTILYGRQNIRDDLPIGLPSSCQHLTGEDSSPPSVVLPKYRYLQANNNGPGLSARQLRPKPFFPTFNEPTKRKRHYPSVVLPRFRYLQANNTGPEFLAGQPSETILSEVRSANEALETLH